MILIITTNGTAIINPIIPQSHPQKERLTRITKGETPRLSPSIFGSTIFPRIILMATIKTITKKALQNEG